MLPKVLWNSVLATPALVGAALIISSAAIAAETQPVLTEADALLSTEQANPQISSIAPIESSIAPIEAEQAPVAVSELIPASEPVPATPVQAAQAPVAVEAPAQIAQVPTEQPTVETTSSLDQIMQYSSEGSSDSMSQVTSVDQFPDVQPTDWAYQALQSLVERYNCIVGYPDGTFRGQRATTRFEFAAGLNACLDRISELIAASTADLATREDLATLQRLQEEFAAELATLRGRVDGLEARVSELEANQFSTTTKLNGETIFAVGIPFDEDDAFEDQAIAGYRVRLNFDTSFTGEDLLRARLQARDFGDFEGFGGNGSWQWSSSAGDDTVRLDDLVYTFPVGDIAQVIIGANSIGDSDFVATTVSPFDSSGQGSITTILGTPPQYNFIPGGTGLGFIFGFGDNFSLDVGYAAGNAGDPSPGNGLFNGDYGLIAQLSFLSDFVDAAFMYSNSYTQEGFGNFGALGDYESAFGSDEPEVANIYGAQINFKLADFIQIGGGAMYMPVRILDGPQQGDYRVWSYHGTLAFPDLGGDGNLLGIMAGVPPRIAGSDSSLFGALGLGAGNTRQDAAFAAEVFYRFRVNDNISITPGVTYLADPGNDNDVSDTFVGAIRTTFTF